MNKQEFCNAEQFAEWQDSIAAEFAIARCQNTNERFRHCRIGKITLRQRIAA